MARESRGNPFWAIQVSASLDSAQTQVPPLARTLTDRLSRSLSPAPRPRWLRSRRQAGSGYPRP